MDSVLLFLILIHWITIYPVDSAIQHLNNWGPNYLTKRQFSIAYRVFSHDVTVAILVSQNNKTAAMLVSQTGPVGFELFSYDAFSCSNKFA